jgi:hypothetical protein
MFDERYPTVIRLQFLIDKIHSSFHMIIFYLFIRSDHPITLKIIVVCIIMFILLVL